MRLQPGIRRTVTPLPEALPETRVSLAEAVPARRSMFPRLIETVGETLWVVLLFLVIGFFVSKGPTISSIFDDASSAFHRGGESAVQPNEAQIRDLEARMSADERKLSTLERGYSQLKQRHSDLLRAYAELQESRVPRAAGSSPRAAAN